MKKEKLVIIGTIMREHNNLLQILNVDKNIQVVLDKARFMHGLDRLKCTYDIIGEPAIVVGLRGDMINKYKVSRCHYIELESFKVSVNYLNKFCVRFHKIVDEYGEIVYNSSENCSKCEIDITDNIYRLMSENKMHGIDIHIMNGEIYMIVRKPSRKVIVPKFVTVVYLEAPVENLVIPYTVSMIKNNTDLKKPIKSLIADSGTNILKYMSMEKGIAASSNIRMDLSKVRNMKIGMVNMGESDLYLNQIVKVEKLLGEGCDNIRSVTLGEQLRSLCSIGRHYNNNLQKLTILGEPYELSENAFEFAHELREIVVRHDINRRTIGKIEKARDKWCKNTDINYIHS